MGKLFTTKSCSAPPSRRGTTPSGCRGASGPSRRSGVKDCTKVQSSAGCEHAGAAQQLHQHHRHHHPPPASHQASSTPPRIGATPTTAFSPNRCTALLCVECVRPVGLVGTHRGGSNHCCHRVNQACFVRLVHATIVAASYGIKQLKKSQSSSEFADRRRLGRRRCFVDTARAWLAQTDSCP